MRTDIFKLRINTIYEKYKIILLSLLTGFVIVAIYGIGFQNKMSTGYEVYNSPVDYIIDIKSDNQSFEIEALKEYSRLYIPVVLLGERDDVIKIEVESRKGKYSQDVSLVTSVDINDAQEKYENDEKEFFETNKQYLEIDAGGSEEFKVTIDILSVHGNSILLLGHDSRLDGIAYKTVKDTHISQMIFWVVAIITIIGTVTVLYLCKENMPRVENVYLFMALFLGIIYFILLPPGCCNDSTTHIISIYQHVNDTVGKSEWNNIDKCYTIFQEADAYVINEILYDSEQMFAQPNTKMYDEAIYSLVLSPDNDETVMSGWHVDLSTYNKMEYLPYYAVFLIGRALNLNFMLTVQLARIVGYIVFLVAMYVTIRWMPYGKEALAVFALNPMMMQTMMTIGYDLMTIGFSFIGVAFILKISREGYILTKKDIIIAFIVVVLLSSCKGGTYFAAIMVFWILQMICSSNGREIVRDNWKIIGFGAIIGLAAFIYFNMKGISAAGNNQGNFYSVSYFIENLWLSLKTILIGVYIDLDKLIHGLFGGKLGWNEGVLPWAFVVMNILLFFIACIRDDGKRSTKADRNIAGFVSVCLVLGIYFVFFLITEVGQKEIYGLQGRYFIPIVPLVICILKNVKIYCKCQLKSLMLSTWFVAMAEVFCIMSLYLKR